jgi:hypothetical protein
MVPAAPAFSAHGQGGVASLTIHAPIRLMGQRRLFSSDRLEYSYAQDADDREDHQEN